MVAPGSPYVEAISYKGGNSIAVSAIAQLTLGYGLVVMTRALQASTGSSTGSATPGPVEA